MKRMCSIASLMALAFLVGCEVSQPTAGPTTGPSVAPAAASAESSASTESIPSGEVTLVTLNVPNMT